MRSFPANLRGWGPGWPVNRAADMVWVKAERSGTRWLMHKVIAPLWSFLVNECERRGYLFDYGPNDVDDDWGYANRPIAGTRTASNHSWGLAGDIDAQNYPQGQLRRVPPAWLVALFEAYGFRWGGTYSHADPMHFEFMGSITEARFLVAALAAGHLTGVAAPMPPVEMPAPVDYLEAELFLVIEGLGRWACVPGLGPIFLSAAELADGQLKSKGVPTLTLPGTQGVVDNAHKAGL